MTQKRRIPTEPSEVAMWHKLSGYPDNVTDEGEIIGSAGGRRLQSEKEMLRLEIARLKGDHGSGSRVGSLARLAASYLVAGDVEMARRCVAGAQEILAQQGTDSGG